MFAGRWTVDATTGCWLWTGPTNPRGYGMTAALAKGKRRSSSAHRASYEIHRGPIPAGMHVLHRCDVRLCVNPGHLFLGTNADNVADRQAKGRQSKGERQGFAKLTEADVLAIRRLGRSVSQRKIAAQFGVDSTVVSRILRRHTWKHLPGEPGVAPVDTQDNRGEGCATATLTMEKVLAIRRLRGRSSNKEIAARFGIHNSWVSRLLHRKAWAHVPEEDSSAVRFNHGCGRVQLTLLGGE